MEEYSFDVSDDTSLDNFKDNPVIEEEPIEEAPQPVQATAEVTNSSEPEVIGTIPSASYGGLTKILSLLTGNMGKSDVISIEEGKLSTVSGNGYLYCDLEVLFGSNSIDITDPQHSIKLMKLITGGDEVTFIDDDADAKYYISNLTEGIPQIDITLIKPDPTMNPRITRPNIGELQEVVSNIDPDLVNTITSAEKNLDSQYFILNIIEGDDKFSVSNISTDKSEFKFNFKELGGTTTSYKLFSPFPIPKPDEIEFGLYKTEAGELWIKTVSEVGMANIEYMEKLTPMGLYDTFSFT